MSMADRGSATSVFGSTSAHLDHIIHHLNRPTASGNILTVFAKYRGDGKATIRLKDPPLDVAICKTDPAGLTAFLDLLYVIHTRPENVVNAPGTSQLLLNPGTKKELQESLQTTMTVDQHREFPKRFPDSISKLYAPFTCCPLLLRMVCCLWILFMMTLALLTLQEYHISKTDCYPAGGTCAATYHRA